MISIASFEVLDLEEPKNTDKYTLNPLPKNDDFYQQIEADFKAAGLVINKLERLRCHYSWKKYESARSNTEERTPQDPAFLLNERYLYHGTRAPKDRLCEEGFDVNLASLGCFGKGIYFSDTPLKCVKYADDTILVARVILGEIKEYEDKKRAPDLFREPEKPEPFVGWRFYDSVKGRPRNHMEYVIYRSERTLIEFIVTFSKADSSVTIGSQINLPQDNKAGTTTGNNNTGDTKTKEWSNGTRKAPGVAPKPIRKQGFKKTKDTSSNSSSDSDDGSKKTKDTSSNSSSDSDNGSKKTKDTSSNSSSNSDDGTRKAPGVAPKPIRKQGSKKTKDTSSNSSSDSDDDGGFLDAAEGIALKKPSKVKPLRTDSVIPYFVLPKGELSLEKKKEEYKRVTQEQDDSEVDKIFKSTDEDVERAIYLFFAYKQVREEEEKRKRGEYVDDQPEKDDGLPIFPPMVPLYGSEEWKQLNEDEQKSKTDKMIEEFLLFTALDHIHRQVAVQFVSNAQYDLDNAVIKYYTAWI